MIIVQSELTMHEYINSRKTKPAWIVGHRRPSSYHISFFFFRFMSVVGLILPFLTDGANYIQ